MRRSFGGDALEHVGRELDEPLVRTGHTRERAPGTIGERVERDGRVLERLALDEAGEQQVALGPQRQLLVEVEVVVARQEAAGLQLDQRGGDEEELGGDVEAQLLHRLELGQVRVDDLAEADVVELHLLAEDQVEQEVEGSVEHRGGDVVGHRDKVNHTGVVLTPNHVG